MSACLRPVLLTILGSAAYLGRLFGQLEFVVDGGEAVAVGRESEATLRLDERQRRAVAGPRYLRQQLATHTTLERQWRQRQPRPGLNS